MADNYLERKMEALGHGATVFRKDNPSLDTLIRKLGTQKATNTEKVKQAQLDAVARSAAMLGKDMQTDAQESTQSIRYTCRNSEELGEVILASRLKAAELGLVTAVELTDDPKAALQKKTVTESNKATATAIIRLFK